MPEPAYSDKGASFSENKRYRYSLWRDWDGATQTDKKVLFVMLNPSTADENMLDPTVRRCLGYAQDWGFKRMAVANLFALRSTDPKVLYQADDPVGSSNDVAIIRMVADSEIVIAAWGRHGIFGGRDLKVIEIITRLSDIYCIALIKGRIPAHPLYLKKTCTPILYARKDDNA